MENNNGFTLAEMVAVIAILMLLAVLSTPFIKGYIDDAYNGKALIYMRELNEARMNFERDYPGTKIGGGNIFLTNCNIEDIYGQTSMQLEPSILVACKYVRDATDVTGRYSFQLGSSADCTACSDPVISMIGGDNAGIYKNKCACIDSFGKVCKQNTDDENTTCL